MSSNRIDRAPLLKWLEEHPTSPLAEAGREFGVSRERIRQIEAEYGISARARQRLRTTERAAAQPIEWSTMRLAQQLRRHLLDAGYAHCHACRQVLPLEAFTPYQRARALRGEASLHCAECACAQQERYHGKRGPIRGPAGAYLRFAGAMHRALNEAGYVQCQMCKQVLPAREFPPSLRMRGRSGTCHPCAREYERALYARKAKAIYR